MTTIHHTPPPAKIEARGETPDPTTGLELTAAIDIAAAASDKPASFAIDAYGGGRMRPLGYLDDVVIDLAGVTAPPSVPLLADHDNRLTAMLGSGEVKIDRRGHKISIAGRLAAETMIAQHALKLAAAGVTIQASVGGSTERVEFVRAGETVEVNGQTFDGPIQVVRAMKLREVSILPAGADSSTSVKIAATSVPSTPNPVQAERERIGRIDRLCAGFSGSDAQRVTELRERAIEGELAEHDLAASLVEIMRASRPTNMPGQTGGRRSGTDTQVLAAATLMLAGREDIAEKSFGEQNTQLAADLRCHTLLDLCAAALGAEHRDVPTGRGEMITAAFSTISLPTALGASAEKMLLDAFAGETSTWARIAREVNLRNFRDHPTVRAYMIGRLEKVAPDGELKYASLGEGTGSIKAETFGVNLGITRQNVINDDLGFFDQVSNFLGVATQRRMSDDAYELLLSNPSSFFHADNANYFDGASSALSVDSLATAVQMLRKQEDEDGRPISLRPSTLVVPPELETTARAILNSAELGTADGSPTGNAMKGVAELEVEPRLSNDGFTGYSATAWYLFAQRQVGALQVGLVNGKAMPTIEFFGVNSTPSVLGLTWRVYHDFGFALGEPRGAVKSKGAA